MTSTNTPVSRCGQDRRTGGGGQHESTLLGVSKRPRQASRAGRFLSHVERSVAEVSRPWNEWPESHRTSILAAYDARGRWIVRRLVREDFDGSTCALDGYVELRCQPS